MLKKISILLLTIIFACFFSFPSYGNPQYRVMLDPGHGGHDVGAISVNGKFKEKDLNLDTSLATKKKLEKHGVEVKMTRSDDTYLKLDERVRLSNEYEPDMFISIHHNASENPKVNRGEVIYKVGEGESQRLAECLQGKLEKIGDLEVKIYNRYNSKGTEFYGVLRGNNAPSVIVEVSFITSEEGLSLVDTIEERERNGVLIGEGILDFLNVNYKEDKSKSKKEFKLQKEEDEEKSALELLLGKAKQNRRNKGINRLLEILYGKDK